MLSFKTCKDLNLYETSNDWCALMKKTDGPWASCLKILDKDLVDGAVTGCTFDICALEGSQSLQASYRCLAYELFSIQCNNLLFNQLQNPITDWRTKTNCRKFSKNKSLN